jgi:ABC-type nitrate/sulfonate/bicarbonate transport system substrate-binding protein
MKRSHVIAGAGALLAAQALPARAQTRALLPIKVGISPIESYGEALYAQSQDFFKTAGLDAQGVTLPGAGAAMTLAVISGALDAAVANIGSIAAAHAHGVATYLLAPCGLYTSASPTTILGVLKNSPVRGAHDLEGKTVGVTSLRDLQQASVMNWVDANGGNAKNTTFVEISTPQMLPALTAGRVAAGVFVEPTLTAVKNDVRVLGLPYDSVASTLAISGWLVNAGWYDANAEAAARLLTVIRTTAQWANRNQSATGAILAEHTKIPPELVATMHRVTYAETRTYATLQPVIDVSVKYGFITQTFPAAELFPANLRHEGRI